MGLPNDQAPSTLTYELQLHENAFLENHRTREIVLNLFCIDSISRNKTFQILQLLKPMESSKRSYWSEQQLFLNSGEKHCARKSTRALLAQCQSERYFSGRSCAALLQYQSRYNKELYAKKQEDILNYCLLYCKFLQTCLSPKEKRESFSRPTRSPVLPHDSTHFLLQVMHVRRNL